MHAECDKISSKFFKVGPPSLIWRYASYSPMFLLPNFVSSETLLKCLLFRTWSTSITIVLIARKSPSVSKMAGMLEIFCFVHFIWVLLSLCIYICSFDFSLVRWLWFAMAWMEHMFKTFICKPLSNGRVTLKLISLCIKSFGLAWYFFFLN